MMLALKNISKSFMQRGLVLNDLHLEVNEGDTVSISGPSGSGKTTLLNIIGLLDRPDRGEVLYRGQNVLGYNQEESALYRNRNIGFVFQDHLLLPYLTVLENILLPLLASFTSDHDYRQKADEARRMIEKTGITGIESKYPYQISGGEAQRATLVRALVNQPSLLLADEPTGSLDRRNAENLGNLLADVNREYGTTLILATHSQELADRMKVQYSLSEGRLTDGKH
jgi:ABC-type lipoprotein export system ATPase subunit